MAYGSYSGDNPPANSRINIESDDGQNLPIDNFDREETQFDSQGNIVSTIPPSPGGTGEIQFRRDIYSPVAFKQKVDTSFSELNNQSQIDIPTFFREYNRLFFDIPKQGANSHETIINESRAYFQDYQDPKDSTITGLNTQINELNSKILELELEILSGTSSLGLENLPSAVGDPSDPNISWFGSFEENGLKETVKKIYNTIRNNGGFGSLSDGENFVVIEPTVGDDGLTDNSSGTYIIFGSNTGGDWGSSNLNRDINQAYRRAKFSGLESQNTRKWSQWTRDIERDSSGNRQKDALLALDYVAYKLTNNEIFLP